MAPIFEVSVRNGSWKPASEEKINIEIIDLYDNKLTYVSDGEVCKDHIEKIFIDEDTYIVKSKYTDGGLLDSTHISLHAPLEILKGK